MRHSKTVSSVTTYYIWDGSNIIAEYNQSNQVTARYIRGINLIFSEDGSGGNRKYYLYNAHGDVVQLADAAGNIVWKYDYDAFGNEKPIAGQNSANDSNPFRYCAEYYDVETKTVYLRNRSYSPGTGRFTNEDPIRDGLNWYTYCGGNPVAFYDPTGCYYVVQNGNEYSLKKQGSGVLIVSTAFSAIPFVGGTLAKQITESGDVLGGTSVVGFKGGVLTDKLPKMPPVTFAFAILGSQASTGMRMFANIVDKLTIERLDQTLWALMDVNGLSSTGFTNLDDLVSQMDKLHAVIDDNPDYFGAYASFAHEGYTGTQFMKDYNLFKMSESDRLKHFDDIAASYSAKFHSDFNFHNVRDELIKIRMKKYNELIDDYNKRTQKMKSFNIK